MFLQVQEKCYESCFLDPFIPNVALKILSLPIKASNLCGNFVVHRKIS